MCDYPVSCRERRPQAACRGSHVASPPRICAIPRSVVGTAVRRPHVGARAWRAHPEYVRFPVHFVGEITQIPNGSPTWRLLRATSHEPLKKALSSQTTLFLSSLNITLDFTGTKATSANINSFYFAVDDSADTLDIRFPGFFRFQVGMADIHAAHCSFTTDFAKVCHWLHLPAPSQYNI